MFANVIFLELNTLLKSTWQFLNCNSFKLLLIALKSLPKAQQRKYLIVFLLSCGQALQDGAPFI